MANRENLSYAAELEVLSKDEVRENKTFHLHDINLCS
jgi:hypothetical protein